MVTMSVAPPQSTLRLFLFVFSLHVMLHVAAPATVNTFCPASDSNFTTNSTYQSNLNRLLLTLPEAGSATGFSLATEGQPTDQVFGRVLCRGDKLANYCLSCFRNASEEILTDCAPRERALIYYDDCILGYSDTNSTNSTNSDEIWVFFNPNTVSDMQTFEDVYDNLMGTLTAKAANSSRMFSVGEANYTNNITLYGLVQCMRDLSADECYTCLQNYIQYYKSNYAGKQGGRVYGYECFFRMETYVFFDSSFIEAPPPDQLSPVPGDKNVTSTKSNKGNKDRKKLLALVLVPSFCGVLMILAVYLFCVFRARITPENADDGNSRSFLFKIQALKVATNDFSQSNKIGEGGFGSVYKGILPNGEVIAVKRLSIGSGQGISELKNEVIILAKLRHKNLVNLLGFCLEENEKMLVYELLPNNSLDKFLSDPQKSEQLNWRKRYQIIEGIARGMLYLHEESRIKIIHRDLKTSNILLDENMLPKISDFGLAKLFALDKSRTTSSRIVGTNGYIAPEYLMSGSVSVKLDIFSYGIIVLEILTGRSVTDFHGSGSAPNLISFVWKKWSNGRAVRVIDRRLRDTYPINEVLRCMHIALLCVQTDPSERPDMASVFLMLSSYSMDLPRPSNPAFFIECSTTTTTNGGAPTNTSADALREQYHKRNNTRCKELSTNNVTITEMDPR